MRNEIRCWGLCISLFSFPVSFSGILGLCHQTEGKDIIIMGGGKSQLSAKQMFWLPNSACLFLATEYCCVLGSRFASSRYSVTLPIIIQFVMAYWSFPCTGKASHLCLLNFTVLIPDTYPNSSRPGWIKIFCSRMLKSL